MTREEEEVEVGGFPLASSKQEGEPVGFGLHFDAALEGAADHPLIYTDNRLVGANPDQLDGYWDTKEEAIVNFAVQLSVIAHAAQRHFLFVRRAPELVASNQFEGGTKWRMIGRFSIAKLKENT